MKVRGLLTGMMAATLLGVASMGTARAECPAAYTPDQLTADLGAMTQSLRDLDEATFRATGARMEAELLCIRVQLSPQVYASVYRYIGAAHYLDKDYQVAGRWFRTALELDPTFEWDVNDLGTGHPLRGHFDAQRATAAAEPERLDGMQILAPAGATLLLDGRPLKEAAATGGRPHLLQVVSPEDRSVRQSFLIEGAAIPETFLQSAAVASTPADVSDGRKRNSGGRGGNTQVLDEIAYGDIRVVQIQRVRPPAKTPLMVASSWAAACTRPALPPTRASTGPPPPRTCCATSR